MKSSRVCGVHSANIRAHAAFASYATRVPHANRDSRKCGCCKVFRRFCPVALAVEPHMMPFFDAWYAVCCFTGCTNVRYSFCNISSPIYFVCLFCSALLCRSPHFAQSTQSTDASDCFMVIKKARSSTPVALYQQHKSTRLFFLDFFAAAEERKATDKNCKRAWIYGGSSVNHKAMFFIISMMGFAVLRQRIRTSYRPLHIIRQSTICVSMAYDAYISGIPPQWPSINYGFWLCTLTLSITH